MALLSVNEINKIIKNDLENDISLRSLQVVGEISNLKYHNSGHLYFSLKDSESKINCVMFSTYASKLLFKIEDGMKIVVTCSVGVYVTSGSYQLYVYNIENVGVGGLFLKFEQLKKDLSSQGYFDESHKKILPKYPINIGVISAKEGAAIKDVITTIKRRWPIAKVTLIPCLVQGSSASSEIIDKLLYADTLNFDVVILTRGGGSIEDLWCFNDIEVAKTIYNMKTPIISAIGHEIDFTIADYVSDYRAPTPTGAGEISTPDINDVLDKLYNIKKRLIFANNNLIDSYHNLLKNYKNNPYLTKIENLFADKYSKLELLQQKLFNCKNNLFYKTNENIKDKYNKLINSYNNILENNNNKLINIVGKLETLSPLKIMSRGYGIVSKNDKVIIDTKNISINDEIKTQLKDGYFISVVKEIKGDK